MRTTIGKWTNKPSIVSNGYWNFGEWKCPSQFHQRQGRTKETEYDSSYKAYCCGWCCYPQRHPFGVFVVVVVLEMMGQNASDVSVSSDSRVTQKIHDTRFIHVSLFNILGTKLTHSSSLSILSSFIISLASCPRKSPNPFSMIQVMPWKNLCKASVGNIPIV